MQYSDFYFDKKNNILYSNGLRRDFLWLNSKIILKAEELTYIAGKILILTIYLIMQFPLIL